MKQFNGRQVDYNILIFKFSHLKTSTTLLHFYYFQYYITQAHSSTSYQLSVSHINVFKWYLKCQDIYQEII